ncbi:hypothetical protein TREES_T100012256 [Tupaia chinensis]|uniref:Uncharacterized protein n=1 Tax=Tupaia chinensis TaxID=246437 RepID=L9JFE6_TUPCH|nr:hypothetical protein TREES_T100012256 [Tupaia chinensis]
MLSNYIDKESRTRLGTGIAEVAQLVSDNSRTEDKSGTKFLALPASTSFLPLWLGFGWEAPPVVMSAGEGLGEPEELLELELRDVLNVLSGLMLRRGWSHCWSLCQDWNRAAGRAGP